MKAVFDTNVLIAAFVTEGVCSKLLIRARRGNFDLILSTTIIQEFTRILHKKFSVAPSEISNIAAVLSEAASDIIKRTGPIPPTCRDPDDDLILACARDAGANYIVTGDEDLLVLKSFQGIGILKPRDFESLFSD